MFWEIIATVLAGFLAAGLVLPLRFYKKTPKWTVPVFAGLGMMVFQVYSEYTWFANAQDNLPQGSVVVAEVAKSSWFRPWSYVHPQIFWFVVLDKNSIQSNRNQKQATLYFIERHASIHPLQITLDCQAPKLDMEAKMSELIIELVCNDTTKPSA